MKQIVRGAGVHISATFKDDAGDIIQPSGANVTLSFIPKNNTNFEHLRSFFTYAMTAPTDPAIDWTFDWDSSIASPGVVYGNAVTTTVDVPISSVDFSFRLIANRANRELAGDFWD